MELTVENISVFYGRAQALEDISIHLGEAEIISIIGSNGAGKSTLLKTICGLLSPRQGRVAIDGVDTTGYAPYKIARLGMAMVPEGRQIFMPLTVRENLEMGVFAGTKSKGKKAIQAALDEVYELFPILKERKNQLGSSLSGGEQQMLAIGRALMSHPKMLLLDEPSLGLAPIIVEHTFNTLRELHRSGMAILLVEQNAFEALQLADRAYVLESGRLATEGSGTDLLNDKSIQNHYLGGKT